MPPAHRERPLERLAAGAVAGVAAVVALSALFISRPQSRSQRLRPNVLLISIDTLRADRLGCYGYGRDTSPALDALARDGVRFQQAISQAPWTTPSHMSLLTSLYPSAHRVNQDWQHFSAFRKGKGRYRMLPSSVETLAEVLRGHDYRTLALTGGGTIAGALGFAQGFDVYREDAVKLTPKVKSQLADLLRSVRSVPFFLFFHTFEVHAPYRHLDFARALMTETEADGLEQLFAQRGSPTAIQDLEKYLRQHGLFRREITSALYDGGVRHTDDFLAWLFDELRRLSLYDRTLIVVTSDHGEEFGEHDATRIYDSHCRTLYDELIHVPLIMRTPGRFQPGTVVHQQVELVDIAPTVLDLLGIPVPSHMQGRSLVNLMAGEDDAPRWAVSEATCIGPEWKSLRTGLYKYVMMVDPRNGERSGLAGPLTNEQFFDLRADPREQRNLDEEQSERARHMRGRLEQLLGEAVRQGVVGASAPVSDGLRERLRALGYTN